MATKVEELPLSHGAWIEDYFTEFERYANKSDATKYAGVSPSTVKEWRNKHEDFREREAEARAVVLDRVRKELLRRSIDGTVKPIYQEGKLVGAETVYDNKLLMFVAERLLREEYHLASKLEVDTQTTVRFDFRLGEREEEAAEIEGSADEIEDAQYDALPPGEGADS